MNLQGLLALFVRSLREENRRISTYVVRIALIGFILILIAINHQASQFGGSAPGLRVFQSVTVFNLVFIVVLGLGYFSSAITEEKEDGTLGLLRMTDLNPLSILLGKSTSRLIGFLMLLLVQVPFVLLCVALGGVGWQQIFSCYLILLSFTFLLGNLALIFSVICARTPVSVAWTLAVLILVFGGVWFLGNLLNEAIDTDLGLSALGNLIWKGNPINSLMEVFKLGFNDTLVTQPLSNIIAGILCFFIAWSVFDRYNQGEGRAASPGPKKPRWVSSQGSRPSTKPRPQGLAITWREFYYEWGGTARLWLTLTLILIFSGVALGIGSILSHSSPPREAVAGTFIAIGLMWAGIQWMVEMATVFKHERRNQTWSALSLLPKSIPRIAYEKVLACLVATLPGILVAAFGFFIIADEILDGFRWQNVDEMLLVFALGLGWFLFLSHLIVYLSLFLKWGALPVSLVCAFMAQILISILGGLVAFGMRSPMGIFTVWMIMLFGAATALHVMIGMRLAALAAKE